MYRTILVANDGSDRAKRAMQAAVELAREVDARLITLNVQVPYAALVAYSADGILPFDGLESHEQAARAQAERALDAAREYARSCGVSCETLVVSSESIPDAIVETAAQRHCDMIMMGSPDGSALSRLLLGSISQRVVEKTSVPVVLHK